MIKLNATTTSSNPHVRNVFIIDRDSVESIISYYESGSCIIFKSGFTVAVDESAKEIIEILENDS